MNFEVMACVCLCLYFCLTTGGDVEEKEKERERNRRIKSEINSELKQLEEEIAACEY